MAVNGDDGSGDGGGYRNKLDAKHIGLKLYVWIAIGVGSVIVISLIFLLCCLRNRKRTITKRLRVKNIKNIKNTSGSIPIISKDIEEISKLDQPNNVSVMKNQKQYEDGEEISTKAFVGMEKVDKIKRIGTGIQSAESSGSNGSQTSALSSVDGPIGWGRWYTMREMEIATRGFSVENVIGEGGYGIVYRGVLGDNSVVAVKNLFNNKGQAEQEFKVEVEAIGKVRHKNLVGLIGYCVEGSHRMLVYEYVNNGNLEQWLHGEVGPVSPLTWDIRMKIAIGTAKGLSYLHEGLEPKVVHRDVKSSNILLDRRWNPKVSDFGLAKLLGSEASFVTTRVMGTFGYVAPEYASSGKLNERSDVYSFGVLLMELISGRTPVDYSRPAGEVNLVDWLKMKVASRHGDEVVDPLIENPPPPRALKRALLVCLRCIDLEADKRPKMGQVLHMLEADEFPYRAEHRSGKDKTHIPAPQDPAPPDDTPFASRIAMGR